MTVVVGLLFATAFLVSVCVIAFTIGNAWPRIQQAATHEFGPSASLERRITFGEVKGRRSLPMAEVIPFPRKAALKGTYLLAA